MAPDAASVRLSMIRSHLRGLPKHSVPPPFRTRWYRPGDEAAWVNVWRRADPALDLSVRTFEKEFGREADALAQRQCFLCDGDDVPIGTATAWYDSNYHGAVYGRIHWVAVVPEMQGRGLGKAVLSAACDRLIELGHDRAYLLTESPRLRAIRMYLDFGFVPQVRSPEERDAWRAILTKLGVDSLTVD